MIHYFPLEHIETRYTGHLDKSIVQALDAQPQAYRRYYPQDVETQAPAPGNFFHHASNLQFRARQLASFASEVKHSAVAPGDMVFLSDLLIPGIEFFGYLEELHDLHLEIRGLVHAGSFSDADMTRSFERWYAPYETLAFDLATKVFLGSEFIRRNIVERRLVDPAKLIVTGFELDPSLPPPAACRAPIVVFTGRISPDKQPWLFERLADELMTAWPEVQFIKAVELGLPKHDYYYLLSNAKVVVSFALQETFGTGVREAVKLGCVPVVPNAQCYPEDFPAEYRYDTFDQAKELVSRALHDDLPVPVLRDYPHSTASWFD